MIAIDLGSNSFRAISFDCTSLSIIDEYEAIVKTADKLHQNGEISEGAVERIIHALQEADKKLHFQEHTVKAVTTQAMRKARNSAAVLKALEQKSGVAFEIIGAEKEAYYTLTAVEARLKTLEIKHDHFVLIDVGGGSTEIIFYRNGVMESQSFPIGIVTTAQICDEGCDMQGYLDEAFKPLCSYVEGYYEKYAKPATFVATAGTPTTMAAYLLGMSYKNYDVQKINGYRLSLEGTKEALNGLMALSEMARAEIVGVGRESLIQAGIIIVQKLYATLGFTEAIVIDDGVREGVAIAYCNSIKERRD